MNIFSPKQLKKRENENIGLNKKRIFKTLEQFDKVRKKFIEFKIKIRNAKERILTEYNVFLEQYNEEKIKIGEKIKQLEKKRKKLLKPIIINKEKLKQEAKENKELYESCENSKQQINDKVEYNQSVLEKIDEIKKYNIALKESIKKESEYFLRRKQKVQKKEIKVNNLERKILISNNNEKAIIIKKEKEVKARESILKINNKILQNKEKELIHIKIKLQDEREALNRAKQDI